MYYKGFGGPFVSCFDPFLHFILRFKNLLVQLDPQGLIAVVGDGVQRNRLDDGGRFPPHDR